MCGGAIANQVQPLQTLDRVCFYLALQSGNTGRVGRTVRSRSGARNPAAALLHDMRQFMRQQFAAGLGFGGKFPVAEHDVPTRRIGARIEFATGLIGGCAGMDHYVGKIIAEIGFHIPLHRRWQRLARSCQRGLDAGGEWSPVACDGCGWFRRYLRSLGIFDRIFGRTDDFSCDLIRLAFLRVAGLADRQLGLHEGRLAGGLLFLGARRLPGHRLVGGLVALHGLLGESAHVYLPMLFTRAGMSLLDGSAALDPSYNSARMKKP